MNENNQHAELSVVFDLGSGTCKAGFGGDSSPRVLLPSIWGQPKFERKTSGSGYYFNYLGDNVRTHRGILKLHYPIEGGFLHPNGDWEHLFEYICRCELRAYYDAPMLFIEPPLQPRLFRARFAETMFETYEYKNIHLN